MEKKKKQDEEEMNFLASTTGPRFIFKKETLTRKAAENQVQKEYNWIKRKNAYNEDDVEYSNLPEENMIVASWIDDMGNNHKEFDVSLTNLKHIGQNPLFQ